MITDVLNWFIKGGWVQKITVAIVIIVASFTAATTIYSYARILSAPAHTGILSYLQSSAFELSLEAIKQTWLEMRKKEQTERQRETLYYETIRAELDNIKRLAEQPSREFANRKADLDSKIAGTIVATAERTDPHIRLNMLKSILDDLYALRPYLSDDEQKSHHNSLVCSLIERIKQQTPDSHSKAIPLNLYHFSSAYAQEKASLQEDTTWHRIITGQLDMRPFLRAVAIVGAMLALAASGIVYLFASDQKRRKEAFTIMSYLGTFIGGALFGS